MGLSLRVYIESGPAKMHRLCMRINQSIVETYLYLVPNALTDSVYR